MVAGGIIAAFIAGAGTMPPAILVSGPPAPAVSGEGRLCGRLRICQPITTRRSSTTMPVMLPTGSSILPRPPLLLLPPGFEFPVVSLLLSWPVDPLVPVVLPLSEPVPGVGVGVAFAVPVAVGVAEGEPGTRPPVLLVLVGVAVGVVPGVGVGVFPGVGVLVAVGVGVGCTVGIGVGVGVGAGVGVSVGTGVGVGVSVGTGVGVGVSVGVSAGSVIVVVSTVFVVVVVAV